MCWGQLLDIQVAFDPSGNPAASGMSASRGLGGGPGTGYGGGFAIAFWYSSNAFMAANWVRDCLGGLRHQALVSLLLFVARLWRAAGRRGALVAPGSAAAGRRAMSAVQPRRALVLLSGGRDSATLPGLGADALCRGGDPGL